MSFDGLVLRAVTIDLQEKLCGARIDKIYQPTKHEIILTLRQTGATYKLLLSSLAQEARVHLVSQTAPNPPEPPLFCMVLRKHLEGGKILSFSQPNLERILEINCEVIDELGIRLCAKLSLKSWGNTAIFYSSNRVKIKLLTHSGAFLYLSAAIGKYCPV